MSEDGRVESGLTAETKLDAERGAISPGQWAVVALILAEVAFALSYGVLRHEGLLHSGAIFVGLPAVLAIVLALAPKAKSATGGILRGITLALLIVAPLLGEGYVCILIASPLFYAVGLIFGVIADRGRRHRAARVGCVAFVLLPMCLEGVVPGLTHGREQRLMVSKTVQGTPYQVWEALSAAPRLDTPVPRFWRLGFPRPIAASGSGLAVGAERTIRFSAAENRPAGDLVLRVAQAELWRNGGPRGSYNVTGIAGQERPAEGGYAVFDAVKDDSKINDWMRWKRSEVEWTDVGSGQTLVMWTITFDRRLDPWWYFGMWETVAAHEAAGYLIDANATPDVGAVR
jgi:hypothetical protein